MTDLSLLAIIWYGGGLYGALGFIWTLDKTRDETRKYAGLWSHAPIWRLSGLGWALALLLAFGGPLPLIASLVVWVEIVMDGRGKS